MNKYALKHVIFEYLGQLNFHSLYKVQAYDKELVSTQTKEPRGAMGAGVSKIIP